MKDYILPNSWKIIEEGFNPEFNRISESLCSLGNGHMGQRGNFEETYSGDTLQGNYMAGVYYPDKTIVGWWKNGYPEYFAKVLNAPNWIGLKISIDECELDLAQAIVEEFHRELDMKTGILNRMVRLKINQTTVVEIDSSRFVSMVRPEVGCLRYALRLVEGGGTVMISSFIDGNIYNEDANYHEYFWEHKGESIDSDSVALVVETKKTGFTLASRVGTMVTKQNTRGRNSRVPPLESQKKDGWAAQNFSLELQEGESLVIEKMTSCLTDRDHPVQELLPRGKEVLNKARKAGFAALREEHCSQWAQIWEQSDITIDGDVSAQQGIRFNIFQLKQTYTGKDERLNIGPKGFTGEKYGGASYWDTEAYCLPFFLSTADSSIARQLLVYRHKHLERAIENAEKLGFTGGAALYPMVTMNGEECHNEWEITFEEIHRNGAIAHAIYDYINCTGDKDYLLPWGMEVLTGISRFWAQRVNWSEAKQKYVILGVTGPNEYENNVHNNWYTNTIAAWTLRYTAQCAAALEKEKPSEYKALAEKNKLYPAELTLFTTIADQMYLPEDKERGVFLQQDGFLDKEVRTVKTLRDEDRPLNQKWSWDRILRSCFIKQADVLQGLFLFEDDFDKETHRRNFDFYEPMTVHESSLSPCVHTILAQSLGYSEKAYEMYVRAARLDLDDYNNDTDDGCHITSMAGTWMSIVMGFGGLRHRREELFLNPGLPAGWKGYSFKLMNHGVLMRVAVSEGRVEIENQGSSPLKVNLGTKDDFKRIELMAGEKSFH
ncbi:family 65 glycosyl hydrolase domain-containing protein [Oceanispirochaeta sp.]|jgi:maltose phosphorylase|uniref:family 65 glycosyl hydrolase domain-containing protein n=1 Tax=Oceanispirochaeta sp. TaxID=2035350 RepID=UPI002603EDEF|nr:family 65 glycosyl hydrolase domain-containing protein [Oceanispirochaeta sp.]MDA3955927.1 family 65 glycosyl hydrolase domain-containing protein [Oceanispirochaeta sp.]